ncbi:MAG: class I SAM-dependent methyltransferase [Deltaproteobacteria bacterium]|nr:class I SAM-dependent methyltransferase [Deltaproteobacteria bacterium]MBI4224568.1 class I SAM-dependent methyltransferase [Deltaproteobacteria bacterium]
MKAVHCRICLATGLTPVLDYGRVALSDSFLAGREEARKEKKFPLKLCICPHCRHLQIDEIVDPRLLFAHYPWETGISKSVLCFAQELYQTAIRFYRLLPAEQAPKVLEIASNDGSVLSVFQKNGCEVLGIDPAENIVQIANGRGIRSLPEFFDLNCAKAVVSEYGQWDIGLARNVLAHVKDLHGLAEGIRTILNREGFVIIEVPHLKTMFRELQYDQVFHEHLGYHSLDSVQKLFFGHGMEIFDVEEVWIHGGSIRVFLQHEGGPRPVGENVRRVLEEEKKLGLYREEAWGRFARRAAAHRDALRGELKKLKGDQRKIAVYGASGKGQSLLQFCGLDGRLIDYVVDKSAMKQNKWTPGTHLPIFSPARLYEERPDVVLLCAWNFAKEIVEQEKRFVEEGGRFLHPFPMPHYLP